MNSYMKIKTDFEITSLGFLNIPAVLCHLDRSPCACRTCFFVCLLFGFLLNIYVLFICLLSLLLFWGYMTAFHTDREALRAQENQTEREQGMETQARGEHCGLTNSRTKCGPRDFWDTNSAWMMTKEFLHCHGLCCH